MENRCPLSMFQPKNGAPVYVGSVNVSEQTQTEKKLEKSVFTQTAEYHLQNGFLTSPIDGIDANADGELSISFDVKCEPSGKWAVLLSYGHWDRGWFIQNFEGVWRFRIGNINCDSQQPIPMGKWVHLEAVLKNGEAKIYQDGEEIASAKLNAPPRLWLGDLFIGQYALTQKPEYQFNGVIRNLKIESVRETD